MAAKGVMLSGQKRCSKCLADYPGDTTHFHYQNSSQDGLSNICLKCKLGDSPEKLEAYWRKLENHKIYLKNQCLSEEEQADKLERERQLKNKLHRAYRQRKRAKENEGKPPKPERIPKPKPEPRAPKPVLTVEGQKALRRIRDAEWRLKRGQEPRVQLDPAGAAARQKTQRANHRHKRKALERGARGTFTESQFAKKVQRQNQKCYWSHAELPVERNQYHADHVQPITCHPDNSIANIVAACKVANESKRELLPWDWYGVRFCQWARMYNPDHAVFPLAWNKPQRTEAEKLHIKKRYPTYPQAWL